MIVWTSKPAVFDHVRGPPEQNCRPHWQQKQAVVEAAEQGEEAVAEEGLDKKAAGGDWGAGAAVAAVVVAADRIQIRGCDQPV